MQNELSKYIWSFSKYDKKCWKSARFRSIFKFVDFNFFKLSNFYNTKMNTSLMIINMLLRRVYFCANKMVQYKLLVFELCGLKKWPRSEKQPVTNQKKTKSRHFISVFNSPQSKKYIFIQDKCVIFMVSGTNQLSIAIYRKLQW